MILFVRIFYELQPSRSWMVNDKNQIWTNCTERYFRDGNKRDGRKARKYFMHLRDKKNVYCCVIPVSEVRWILWMNKRKRNLVRFQMPRAFVFFMSRFNFDLHCRFRFQKITWKWSFRAIFNFLKQKIHPQRVIIK